MSIPAPDLIPERAETFPRKLSRRSLPPPPPPPRTSSLYNLCSPHTSSLSTRSTSTSSVASFTSILAIKPSQSSSNPPPSVLSPIDVDCEVFSPVEVGVGQVGQGEGREDRSYSLMAPPSASLLTSFFSPQKNSTPGPGWSMSPAPTTWLSSSGTSSAWSSAPSSMASASSSSIPEEFLSPPPQTFGSQLYGGGSRPQTDVKHLSTLSLRQEMRK